jgi:hypothetical protein
MLGRGTQAHPRKGKNVSELELSTGSTRDVLVNLIMRSLRAQAGILRRKDEGKSTGYYAGRMAGFVCSVATVASIIYGTDYAAAKAVLEAELKEVGEQVSADSLYDEAVAGNMATLMVERVLAAQ